MLFSHHRMTDIGEERESVGSKEGNRYAVHFCPVLYS